MRPRQSQVRAKEFEVDDLRRQLRLFEQMIGDLAGIRDELGRQIAHEEARTGVADRAHFAYSTVARAARERRDKLAASIEDLEDRRAAVAERLDTAEAALDALRQGTDGPFSAPLAQERYQCA